MPNGRCSSKVQAEGRFPDRRTSRDHHHLSAVQPLGQFIKLIEARGHTGHAITGCRSGFNFVDGLSQNVTQGDIIFPGTVLADFIDLGLGFVDDVFNFTVSAITHLGNFGANIDDATQDGFFGNDFSIKRRIGCGRH